jgi:hypothetical protein
MLQQEGIPPDEVVIICTDEAWTRHEGPLTAEIRHLTGLSLKRRAIPNGENPGELWQQFDTLRQEFRVPEDTLLVLDITNGFRSQPFFARPHCPSFGRWTTAVPRCGSSMPGTW